MKFIHAALPVSVLAIALLVACGEKEGVTLKHIAWATELCAESGGVESIANARRIDEWEACGYRCSRVTGKFTYKMEVACAGGAAYGVLRQGQP